MKAATDFLLQSSFHQFGFHQVLTRQTVKTEFILGIAQLLVQSINVSEYQHIQEKVSEIMIGLETMKALLEECENDAELDKWAYMRPSLIPLQVATNIFPRIYPRFCEIIQLIGASGLIILPTENDFSSDIKDDLHRYLQGSNIDAEDRVKLFRLAWDLTMSSFGTRQTQYEWFFFGDPIRLSADLYRGYPTMNYVNVIERFLQLKNNH